RMHDGRAEKAGIHSALNKIAVRSHGDRSEPQCDMHTPFEMRIDSSARLQAPLICRLEFRVLAKMIGVQSVEAIHYVVIPLVKDHITGAVQSIPEPALHITHSPDQYLWECPSSGRAPAASEDGSPPGYPASFWLPDSRLSPPV